MNAAILTTLLNSQIFQIEFIFSLCAKSVWAVEIGAWLAICNHLVYLIWRVKHCGCRAVRSPPGDECLFVLLMPLPESPGSRESPANMQRTSVSRLASGRGLFYCIVNLMVWKCLAKKSCSCHSRVENPNKLTDRSRQFDASLTASQACK